jgi:hypothetical protein
MMLAVDQKKVLHAHVYLQTNDDVEIILYQPRLFKHIENNLTRSLELE